MRLIQKYLPRPRQAEIYRIFVNADPDKAWETARHFDMGKVPWVRVLFDIRTWPDRLKGKPVETDKRLGVDQITDQGKGFIILEEIPGKEVVVGSVGKFWRMNIPFAEVTPGQFEEFDTPGFGKLSWSISVEPYREGSTISIELRTTATDEESWKKLNKYYHIIGPASRLIRSSMMHHLEALLGKSKRFDDEDKILPGDERLLQCKYQATHSVDIEAPVSLVWRYLMQLGCDRAGWYSIDRLDNGGKDSIDHLVKGWGTRNAGDKLWATPKGDSFFEVYEITEKQHFVLGSETKRMNEPFKSTWAFILEPIGDDATHLVTRARMQSEPAIKEWLLGAVLMPPVHALMQKAQLKHLKKICEREAKMRQLRTKEYERT
ncbi:MAG: SRPBCC family protein [Bacteroidota bacterium]|nr:SRPBCC family protein [Bacteroidota bacterium]